MVIGEIKYTCRTGTAKQGLQELMEYCQLLKYQQEYVGDTDIEVVGLLLLDGVALPPAEELEEPLRALRVVRDENGRWRAERKFSRVVEII